MHVDGDVVLPTAIHEIEQEPETLLSDVCWNFSLSLFDRQKAFLEAVLKYNER